MPRLALLLAAALALPAQADLYRWIDPETGSVKLSNSPPAWMSGGTGIPAPNVQLIPARPAPAAAEAAAGTPEKPAAAPEKPAAAPASPVAPLEATWRGLLRGFSALRPGSDLTAAGIQQQFQAYEALGAELDRRDPAGAAKRRTEEAGVMERLRKAFQR